MEWYWILVIIIGSIAALLVLSTLLYKQFFKRFYDIVLSGMALIVLSPLLLILTIVGAIVMKGNPFFVQQRPGRIDKKTGKEKIFKLIKFRTMSNARDKDGNLLPDTLRLNKYGIFLRCSSLDELPELINIFKGEMSVIGPRPLALQYLPYYNEYERHRHDARPGLSGLAQVNGRNSVNWKEKFEFDVQYVNNISLIGDIAIILLSVKTVLKRENIGMRSVDAPIDFDEYRRKQMESKVLL